jgi:hypothetical protein
VVGAGPAIQRRSVMLLAALYKLRSWYWTRRYKAGRTLTQFIANNIDRYPKLMK